MPTVGYASLQVVPSVRGIGSSIREQITGPIEQAGDDAGGGFGKRMLKGSAVVIAAGAAAVGALLVKGVGDAMEQGKITGRLGAQLGATGPEAQRYGHIAGRMWAGAITEDVQGAADAVRASMSSGLLPTGATEQQIQTIATKASDLANTFEVDLGQSANAAGQMIKTGLAKDGTEALDVLTRGFQVMGPRADDLADTFNEYSTLFRQMGLSATQATGLLSQGMQAGARDTDVVADSLKEFVLIAQKGDQATFDAFKTIGLSGKEMQRTFIEGGPAAATALDQVFDRLRGIQDPIERNTTALALFGTKNEDVQKALLALDPSTAVQALGDVAGAADRMGTSLRDNAATKIEKFTRGLEQGLTEVVGGKVLPVLESVGTALAARFGPAVSAAAAWITGTAVPAAAAFGRTVLDTVVPAVTRIASELGDRFGPVAGKAGEVLRADLVPAVTKLGKFLKDDVVPPVIDVAKWLGQHLVPAISTAAGVFVGTLVPALADTARWLADHRTAIAVVAGVLTTVLLPVLVTTAVGYAQSGIAATVSAAQQVAAWVASGGAAVTNAAMSVVASYQTVGGWIAAGASAVASAAQQVWAWVTSGAAAIASAAQQAAAWITIGARIVWGMALQAGAVVEIVAGWVLMGAQSMLQAARMAAAWVLAMGPLGWVIAAVVGLVALVVANWDTVRNATVAAWNWVANAAVNAGHAIVGFFTGWNLVGVLSQIWSTVYNGAVAGWNATINWIRGVPSWIRDGIGNLGSLLVSAGTDVIRGLWNGISSMGSWLKSQMISLVVNTIPGPIREALGIHSPSTVMRDQVGRWIPAGIQEGVEDGRASLDRTMATLVQPPDVSVPAWTYQAQAPMGPAGGGSWAEQAAATPALTIENYYESDSGGARQTAMQLALLAKARG